MPEPSSNFAEVRFLDREAVLDDLRRAAVRARAEHPEIASVLLFGYSPLIPTDTLVYSERKFDRLRTRPGSFLQGGPAAALEL